MTTSSPDHRGRLPFRAFRALPFLKASRAMLLAGALAPAMLLAGPLVPVGGEAWAQSCPGLRDSTSICVTDPRLRPVPQAGEQLNLIVNQTDTVVENFESIINEVDQIEQEVFTLQEAEVEMLSSIDGDVVEVSPSPEGAVTSVVGLLGERLPETMPKPSSFVGWKNGGWSWMEWPADDLVISTDIAFDAIEGAPRNARMTSNTVEVAGLAGPTAISVIGHGNPRLVIDGGAPVQSGMVENGQTLAVTMMSSGAYGNEHRAIVRIGDSSAIFVVTTEAREAYTFLSATGGSVETYGNFRIHEFRTNGSFTINQVGTHPQYGDRVYFLIMGGGGGGGAGALDGGGGGGGAGALRTGTATGAAGTYPVIIGNGGAGAISNAQPGADGGVTNFAGITAVGGGGGGSALAPNATAADGRNGGSGGGGGSWMQGSNAIAGSFGGSSAGRNGGAGSVHMSGGSFQAGGGGGGSWLSAGFASAFAGSATGGDSRMDPIPNFPYSAHALSRGGNGAAASATRQDGADAVATSFGGGGGAGPGGIGGNGAPGAVYVWYRFQ